MSQPLTAETEGVTKYHLDFKMAPAPAWSLCAELDAWRTLLFMLQLTGQDSQRYGGLAYGNVSRRVTHDSFLISGTQTGALPRLSAQHYCRVDHCNINHNRITAQGPIPPSSEALTHGAAYLASPAIHCVIHVHSPVIWTHAESLAMAVIDPVVAYGTPEMAESVAKLLEENPFRVIAMGGHQDGILSCGATPESAVQPLISHLAQAILYA